MNHHIVTRLKLVQHNRKVIVTFELLLMKQFCLVIDIWIIWSQKYSPTLLNYADVTTISDTRTSSTILFVLIFVSFTMFILSGFGLSYQIFVTGIKVLAMNIVNNDYADSPTY